jgi:D-proline reductase (dithiol) PrdB
MVRLADLPPAMADTLRNLDLPSFESTPWVTPPPLSASHVALVTTAGLHLRSDANFTAGSGQYRVIPGDTAPADLLMSHVSVNFDRSGFQQDVNVVFPLEHLQALQQAGEIASLARYHYSFMGATDPARMAETGPEVGRLLKEDQVDLALLVPV